MVFLYSRSFYCLFTLFSEQKIFTNIFAISIYLSAKKKKSQMNHHSCPISMELIDDEAARGVSFSKRSKTLLKHVSKWIHFVIGLIGSSHVVVLFKESILKMFENSLKSSYKAVHSKVLGCVGLEQYQKMNTINKCFSKILCFNLSIETY